MKTKILVTGAGGFIGTALCRLLDQRKASQVLSIGRRKNTVLGSKYHQVDLLDKKFLEAFIKKARPQIIFHLAGGRSGDPSLLIRDNVTTTMNLLEVVRSFKNYRPRIIITGSAAEYGEVAVRRPILEHAPNSPAGVYGWVKLLQTQMALHYARLGQDIIVARLFNILGSGVGADMVPGKIAHDIVKLEQSKGPKILSVYSLGVVRDFLDIRDIALALDALSTKGKSGEIYNICSQKGMTMKELLAAMVALSSLKGIGFKENKKIKPGVMYAIGSNAKLKRTTGWAPQYSLPQSISDTLSFYRR